MLTELGVLPGAGMALGGAGGLGAPGGRGGAGGEGTVGRSIRIPLLSTLISSLT